MSELLELVGWLSKKYTSNESTSVSYGTAQQLMEAILYCIQLEEEENRLGASVVEEGKDSVRKRYERGYELVLAKARKAKTYYDTMIVNGIETYGLQCYQETVLEGIPKFFLYYDARFYPQDHLLTLDYPTIHTVDDVVGVKRVLHYVNYLHLEQLFLAPFDVEQIVRLLRAHQDGFEDLFFNIASLVLRALVGRVWVGKKENELWLSTSEVEELRRRLIGCTKEELREQTEKCLSMLITRYYEENQQLYEYLYGDVENFVVELSNAVKYDCLERIFPVE